MAFPQITKKSADHVIGPSSGKIFSWVFKSRDLARRETEAQT